MVLLKDKIAIVTGATGALGRVVTKKLLERGAKVVAPYRTESRFNELVDSVGASNVNLTGVQGDCTREKDLEQVVQLTNQKYGRVDILLNLVGGYIGGKGIDETEEDTWKSLMDTNLKTAFLSAKAVLPHMKRQNYGKIVNVAARPAVERRWRAKSVPYAVSKAGVMVLTEGIAEEVRNYDINVNCVLPSTMDTTENRLKYPKADSTKWVPPEQVAEVILFLASDDSKPTSGATIPVYGKA